MHIYCDLSLYICHNALKVKMFLASWVRIIPLDHKSNFTIIYKFTLQGKGFVCTGRKRVWK